MEMHSAMPASVIQHRGRSFPLGATLRCGGANFSVFAKRSRAAQLLLFYRVDDPEPSQVIDLDPRGNRTYHYWHAFVPGVGHSMAIVYRALSIRHGDYVSTPTKCSSILMGNASRGRRREAGRQRKTWGQRGDSAEERGRRPQRL